MRSRAKVVVLGAGIMGLATAWNLARRGVTDVLVVDRSYLCAGASGRNGGGVRAQFSTETNIRLMQESIAICREFAATMGINVWFRQGGYLFLARDGARAEALEASVALQNRCGLQTRLLEPHEALRYVPELAVEGVTRASFNPEDGVVFPWPFVWGYATQAVRHGARLRTHTAVTRVEPAGERYRLQLSTGESLLAARVVNATGAWSHGLNAQLGIHLPNQPHRHEILSSEPLKPFLDPLVVDLGSGLYFSQSTRGELVTGITLPDAQDGSDTSLSLHSSLRFLGHISRTLVQLMPIVAGMKVLRQWVGPYDVSPDGDAIVGPSPGHPRFVQVCGFTGHGFMMAPAVGRLLARWLADGTTHPMLTRWDPGRFASGQAHRREDMIIG